VLRFLCSPVEILGNGRDEPVTGIRIAHNRIEPTASGGLGAVSTATEEIIECGLVLRSIGYRGRRIEEVPFDERRGLIRNKEGRVVDDKDQTQPGEYVVGYVKRGPSGVIGTNKKDAGETFAKIMEDALAGRLNTPTAQCAGQTAELFARHVPGCIGWQGWQAIDTAERAAGRPLGRDRVKLVQRADLFAAAGSVNTIVGEKKGVCKNV
jgi:ferredoxin--NADP+ reductase